jgi:hypothetical protein
MILWANRMPARSIPKGHPNLALHAAWAGQILEWMTSADRLRQLGFPNGEEWGEN